MLARLLLAVAFLIALAVPARADAPKAAQAVLAAEEKLNAALLRVDTATIRKLTTPEWTLITASGATVYRDDAIAMLKKATLTKNLAEGQTVDLLAGGAVAVVRGILRQDGTVGGKPYHAVFVYTDIWSKTPAGWMQSGGQATLAKKGT